MISPAPLGKGGAAKRSSRMAASPWAGSRLLKSKLDAETWVLLTRDKLHNPGAVLAPLSHPGKFSVLFYLFGCLKHPKRHREGSSQTALR